MYIQIKIKIHQNMQINFKLLNVGKSLCHSVHQSLLYRPHHLETSLVLKYWQAKKGILEPIIGFFSNVILNILQICISEPCTYRTHTYVKKPTEIVASWQDKMCGQSRVRSTFINSCDAKTIVRLQRLPFPKYLEYHFTSFIQK